MGTERAYFQLTSTSISSILLACPDAGAGCLAAPLPIAPLTFAAACQARWWAEEYLCRAGRWSGSARGVGERAIGGRWCVLALLIPTLMHAHTCIAAVGESWRARGAQTSVRAPPVALLHALSLCCASQIFARRALLSLLKRQLALCRMPNEVWSGCQQRRQPLLPPPVTPSSVPFTAATHPQRAVILSL